LIDTPYIAGVQAEQELYTPPHTAGGKHHARRSACFVFVCKRSSSDRGGPDLFLAAKTHTSSSKQATMSQVTGEFTPLLFTLPSELPPAAGYRTPKTATPLSAARGESSLSQHTRRSLTPPGSVHTESTPPRPPPIMRLQDALMEGVCEFVWVCFGGGGAHKPCRLFFAR
jgi:hypothetical protein